MKSLYDLELLRGSSLSFYKKVQ